MPAISMELSPAPHPWLEEESTDLFWSSCLGSSSRSSSPPCLCCPSLGCSCTNPGWAVVPAHGGHLTPASCSFMLSAPGNPSKPSMQELQGGKKNLRNLCCEHKMALKPHLARDQIEEEQCSTRDQAEGISLNKATLPAKSHQNQGYRGSSSPSAQGSAKAEHNSECSHAEKPLTRGKCSYTQIC